MYEGKNFRYVTSRLAKSIAALKLAYVMSTPNVTPVHPKSAAYTADWTQGYESGQDSQSSEDEDKARSGAKVAIEAFSDAMESLHQVATNAGRVSPLTRPFFRLCESPILLSRCGVWYKETYA